MNGFRLKEVLVGTDLNGGSETAIRAAAELALSGGGRIHLVHALDLRGSGVRSRMDAANIRRRIRDAQRELDGQVLRHVPSGVPVGEPRVVIGPPQGAIAREAESLNVDLIVLGAHHPGSGGESLFGATAERIAHTGLVPVLVARGRLAPPLRRVLVALDPAEPSVQTLRTAATWSVALGSPPGPEGLWSAELHILYVMPRAPIGSALPFERAAVGPEPSRVVHDMPGYSTLELQEELVWGDSPAREIVRYSSSSASDLIVLCAGRASGSGRACPPYVAAEVARTAPCSVLLIPEKPETRSTQLAAPRARQDALTA